MIPSLRIAVTEKCNLSCEYCPKAGDSYELKDDFRLKSEDFYRIVGLAYDSGFRFFSITGGEPLVESELTFGLASYINDFKDLGYLRLNTNGIKVFENLEEIEKSNFSLVKVSLDDLINFESVVCGVKLLRERDVSVRINMVVTNTNYDCVFDMIEFAKDLECELKLFDLTYYKEVVSKDFEFWKKKFVSLKPVVKYLEDQFGGSEVVYSVGNYGNPMQIFNSNSSSPIRVRSSEDFAFYSSFCENCSDFMCQDGLSNLTLTCDGFLKTCRPKGLDLDMRLFDEKGVVLSNGEILDKFRRVKNFFEESVKIKRSLNELNVG